MLEYLGASTTFSVHVVGCFDRPPSQSRKSQIVRSHVFLNGSFQFSEPEFLFGIALNLSPRPLPKSPFTR